MKSSWRGSDPWWLHIILVTLLNFFPYFYCKSFFKIILKWAYSPLLQSFTFILFIFFVFLPYYFLSLLLAQNFHDVTTPQVSCLVFLFPFLILSCSLIMKCTNVQAELPWRGCSSYVCTGGPTSEGWNVRWGARWCRQTWESWWKAGEGLFVIMLKGSRKGWLD